MKMSACFISVSTLKILRSLKVNYRNSFMIRLAFVGSETSFEDAESLHSRKLLLEFILLLIKTRFTLKLRQ